MVLLQELKMSVSRANKAAAAMETFSALFNVAVVATDGSITCEQLPHLVDISDLCDTLARSSREAISEVEAHLDRYERSLKQ